MATPAEHWMRVFRCLSLGLLLTAAELQAADMPDATVKRVKEATVLLDLDVGAQRQNGTGFLVRRDGARKIGYIVSNAHVVSLSDGAEPLRKVAAIFNPGTTAERREPAEVVAVDRYTDLALIKVEGADLPQPLSIDHDAKLKETLPVFAVGFPLADMLAVGERRPAVSLAAGTVSSIRVDDFGVLVVIQLDCDINPGNSGGPVLDAAGNFVGVAVAKVVGTRIGFVIPPHNVRALFGGLAGPAEMKVLDAQPGSVRLAFEADRVDPFGNVRSASVLAVPKDLQITKMTADAKGRWRAIPGAVEMARVKRPGAAGRFAGEFTLRAKPGEAVTYLFQVKTEYADGTYGYGPPQQHDIRFPAAVTGGSGKNGTVLWVPLVPGRDAPAAEKSGRNMVTEDRAIDGARFRTFETPGRSVVRNIVGSADGRTVFLLQRSGVLRRIAVPECKETARLDLKTDANSMAVSSLGLLVSLATERELWIVDETTLEVRRRHRWRSFECMTSSRATSYAFGNSRGDPDRLWVIDLRTGAVAAELRADRINEERQTKVRRHKESVLLNTFLYPTLSPDAQYLFAYSFGCPCRFRVTGPELTWEEIGPRLETSEQFGIDADSQYVAVPGGAKAGNVSDHPQINGSYVYRTKDLQAPILAMPAEKYVQSVAFDPTAKLVYVGVCNVLEARSAADNTVRTYTYGTHIDRVRQILVLPPGKKMILLSDEKVLFVELPDK